MNSLIKTLTALVIAFSTIICFSFVQPAYAATKLIKYEIDYSEDNTYLKLIPSAKGNYIRYTSNGSVPTKRSSLYKNTLCIKRKTTIKAIEYTRNGKKAASLSICVKLRCQNPIITVEKSGDDYNVSLSSSTNKAKIYYTTDGTKPTTESKLYKEPFIVKIGTKVRALSVRENYKNSAIIGKVINKGIVSEPEPEVSPSESNSIEIEDEYILKIFEIVNECRRENGLDEYELDEELCEIAAVRAEELIKNYSHTRPDGSKWHTIFGEYDFEFLFAAENIAYSEGKYNDAEYITNAWINSEAHRKNILDKNCTGIGIGWVKSGDAIYWVQHFAKRK